MTEFEIAQYRLHNQRISADPLGTPAEVVKWLVAAQAQDYFGAQWALGMRMQSGHDADIERAFTDGSILRTHLMRPTWHFITPDDIRWMLALTGPRVQAGNASMYRRQGLDGDILTRSSDLLGRALQGGNQLTRQELRDSLQNAGIDCGDGLRLSLIVMSAELNGIICSGPRRGKQFTYALLDERAPQARSLPRQEALVELARRYFISRGPASLQDFAKWSGLTIADARRGLEAVKTGLESEKMGQQTFWFPASSRNAKNAAPAAYLLSIWDEYICSYKDHSASGEAEVGARLITLGNDLRYIIVMDGKIVGTWRRLLRKDGIGFEPTLFRPLTASENQAFASAAQRYGEFLGLPVIF